MSNKVKPIEDDTKEILQKMNEQDSIQAEIDKCFPEYDVFYKIEFLNSYLDRTYNKINSLLEVDTSKNLGRQMREKITPLRCEIYNFILQLTMVGEHFIKGDDINALRCRDQMVEASKSWVKEPPIALTHIIRNVIAHRRPLTNDKLWVEHTNLVNGEQQKSFRFDLDRKDWKIVLEKLRDRKNLDQGAVENYLSSIGSPILIPETSKGEIQYFFLPVINDCYKSLKFFLQKVEELFQSEYEEQFAKRRELIERFNKVEDWFITRGYIELDL